MYRNLLLMGQLLSLQKNLSEHGPELLKKSKGGNKGRKISKKMREAFKKITRREMIVERKRICIRSVIHNNPNYCSRLRWTIFFSMSWTSFLLSGAILFSSLEESNFRKFRQVLRDARSKSSCRQKLPPRVSARVPSLWMMWINETNEKKKE